MNGVQLPQDQSHFEEAIYFLSLTVQLPEDRTREQQSCCKYGLHKKQETSGEFINNNETTKKDHRVTRLLLIVALFKW